MLWRFDLKAADEVKGIDDLYACSDDRADDLGHLLTDISYLPDQERHNDLQAHTQLIEAQNGVASYTRGTQTAIDR